MGLPDRHGDDVGAGHWRRSSASGDDFRYHQSASCDNKQRSAGAVHEHGAVLRIDNAGTDNEYANDNSASSAYAGRPGWVQPDRDHQRNDWLNLWYGSPRDQGV